MSDRARGHERTPRWLRFMTQHERRIEFLLFGAFFLGLGTLLAVAWVVLPIASALTIFQPAVLPMLRFVAA